MMSSPATTKVSLLAMANGVPQATVRYAGRNPAMPTMHDSTISTQSISHTSHKDSSPQKTFTSSSARASFTVR